MPSQCGLLCCRNDVEETIKTDVSDRRNATLDYSDAGTFQHHEAGVGVVIRPTNEVVGRNECIGAGFLREYAAGGDDRPRRRSTARSKTSGNACGNGLVRVHSRDCHGGQGRALAPTACFGTKSLYMDLFLSVNQEEERFLVIVRSAPGLEFQAQDLGVLSLIGKPQAI